MAYVYEQQMPAAVSDEMYASIVEGLGDEIPEGFLFHLAVRTGEGLKYIDAWRSREDCERFTESRLHPVVGRVLKRFGLTPPGEPPRVEQKVVDLWMPGHRTRGA